MEIVYIRFPGTSRFESSRVFHPWHSSNFNIGDQGANECNWIVPDFVRPIHYSIFEDE